VITLSMSLTELGGPEPRWCSDNLVLAPRAVLSERFYRPRSCPQSKGDGKNPAHDQSPPWHLFFQATGLRVPDAVLLRFAIWKGQQQNPFEAFPKSAANQVPLCRG
jgi:hypothetical protein